MAPGLPRQFLPELQPYSQVWMPLCKPQPSLSSWNRYHGRRTCLRRAGNADAGSSSRSWPPEAVGMEFRRQAELHLFPPTDLIDEQSPDRIRWHRKLATLARAGKMNKAMATLEDMMRTGLYPGPAACHTVVVAHGMAEDPFGAAELLYLMLQAGLEPFAETYSLVLQLCVAHGEYDLASRVYNSVPIPKRLHAWATYCRALLLCDASEKHGYDVLCQGEAEGLEAPGRVQEAALLYLSRQCLKDELRRRIGITSDRDVPIEPQVLSIAQGALEGYISAFESRPPEALERQQIAFYNHVLKEVLARGTGDVEKELVQQVDDEVARRGIAINKEFLSLELKFTLLTRNAKMCLALFRQLSKMQSPVLTYLSDSDFSSMLALLSAQRNSEAMLEVMREMKVEGCSFNVEDSAVSEDGRSIFTAWLPPWQAVKGRKAAEPDQGMDREWLVCDGVTLDATTKCVVDKDGEPIDIDAMTGRELSAELMVRKHRAKGNKAELVQRLKWAREGKPPSRVKALLNVTKKANVLRANEVWKNGMVFHNLVETMEPVGRSAGSNPNKEEGLPTEMSTTKARLESYKETVENLAFDEDSHARIPSQWSLSQTGSVIMSAVALLDYATTLSTFNCLQDAQYLARVTRGCPKRDQALIMPSLRELALRNRNVGTD